MPKKKQQELPQYLLPGGRVKVKIVANDPAFIPMYKTAGAAGADLLANIPPDEKGERVLRLMPGHVVTVDTGIKIQLPTGWEAQIRCRSGLATHGIQVTNGVGTIDEDYRDSLGVILNNTGREIVVIKHKDRIAQLLLKPVWYFNWNIVDKLEPTKRKGGFGSTGTA